MRPAQGPVVQAKGIDIGDEIKFAEYYNSSVCIRIGKVVEIGRGLNHGRIRIKWSGRIDADGKFRSDGKRTWIAASRITVDS